jgi:hypothetical protein
VQVAIAKLEKRFLIGVILIYGALRSRALSGRGWNDPAACGILFRHAERLTNNSVKDQRAEKHLNNGTSQYAQYDDKQAGVNKRYRNRELNEKPDTRD